MWKFFKRKNLDFLGVFPSASSIIPIFSMNIQNLANYLTKNGFILFNEVTENFLSNNQYKNIADFITEYDMKTQLLKNFYS